MERNTAGQFFYCHAFNDTGVVTGDASNIDCNLSKDGGTEASLNASNPVHIGSGLYRFALTAAETDADTLAFRPFSPTPGVFVLGSPSNVIYTTSPATNVLTQAVIETLLAEQAGTVPTVRRGTQWTSTVVWPSITGATAVYYAIKTADVPDDDATLLVRLPINDSGGVDGITRIAGGTVEAASVDVADAQIVRTFDAGENEHTFVLTVKGEASAKIPPTTAIVASNRTGFTRTIEQNGYLAEWKIVGDNDQVMSSGVLRVKPDIVRAVQ